MSPMFVPGPVDVAPEVLAAQNQAMLPHRSQEFEEIFRRVSEKSQQLFFTRERVYLTACSGSGLQEAAVRNLANRRVLSFINGAFGNRWYDVALTNGKYVDKFDVPWNQPVTPEAIFEALKGDSYDLLTVVHNETSTSLQNPIKEIAEAARSASPDTLIAVDAVSSLGGARIEMDAWGLDLVLTSSQKCLALPPGLSLMAVSERALQRAQDVPDRGWYFDLLRLEKHRLKDSSPSTPAMSLIYALDVQLDRILLEGLENRFARHSALAKSVQSWTLERGLGLYAPEGYRSQTVTAVENLLDLNITELNACLMEQDMRIASGYGQLKGKTFRIAHMGETQLADIERLLTALDAQIG
jgi:aspartate aminotransferase-like enzyme